jgi:hypothetical protein
MILATIKKLLCRIGIHKKCWTTFRSEGGMYNTGADQCVRCLKIWWIRR